MANPKGNAENFSAPTPEEAKARGRSGGVASGRARRRRKALRELIETAMQVKGTRGKTVAEDIALALIDKALEGDVKAFVAIRDTIGEKPVERSEVSGPGGQHVSLVVFDGGPREQV